MNRKLSYLLVFACSCFILTGTLIAEGEDEFENLIANGDFEEFNEAPWTMWVEGAAMVEMGVNDEEKLTGEQSILIDIVGKGTGQRVELHQNPFDLKNGQQMTLAFWAKLDEDDIREATMRINHRADPWTTYGSKTFTMTDEWTEFWVTFNMSADDNLVGIYVELNDGVKGRVWFDRFRFYEGEYIEEDIEIEGGPVRAVDPHSKATSTWAGIKADQ